MCFYKFAYASLNGTREWITVEWNGKEGNETHWNDQKKWTEMKWNRKEWDGKKFVDWNGIPEHYKSKCAGVPKAQSKHKWKPLGLNLKKIITKITEMVHRTRDLVTVEPGGGTSLNIIQLSQRIHGEGQWKG